MSEDIPVHELVFFRSIFSLVYCLIFLQAIKVSPWGNNRKWLFLRGIAGTIALLMFFYTIKTMPLASATTIQYLSPIFTIILAMFLNKQRVKHVQWIFFAIAFAGVAMIKGFDPDIDIGIFSIAVGAAFIAGLAYNAVIRCKATEHPMVVVLWFPLVATPIMVVWCLFDWVMPVGIQWLYLLAMGAFTQLAQWYLTKGLQSDLASRVTPINYVGSIYAVAIGYWMFDEVMRPWALAGIGLVLLGVVGNTVVSGKKKRAS